MNLLCQDKNHYSRTVSALLTYCSSTIHAFKNIKNWSHGTIRTFKNYFAIIFSVFSFQFSVSVTISSIQIDLKSYFLILILCKECFFFFFFLSLETKYAWKKKLFFNSLRKKNKLLVNFKNRK